MSIKVRWTKPLAWQLKPYSDFIPSAVGLAQVELPTTDRQLLQIDDWVYTWQRRCKKAFRWAALNAVATFHGVHMLLTLDIQATADAVATPMAIKDLSDQ